MPALLTRRGVLATLGAAVVAPGIARAAATATAAAGSDGAAATSATPPVAPSPSTRSPHTLPARSPLDALLGRRRMVRRFTADEVDDATIDALIAAASRAPSAGTTQPWTFIVVRDRERRAQLGRAAFGQMFVATAPVVIAACADVPRSSARYGDRAERYSTIDVAFASLCLLLKATELGLGACFVGAIDDADVARVLALPPHVHPLAVIPVGWPAERPKAAKIRPPAEVLRRERWSATPPR